MLWWEWLLLGLLLYTIGLGICAAIICNAKGPLSDVEGFEFMNPLWWYRNYPVNPFGAMMCLLFFIILCPIGAVCYWFYKLCTVGRKKEN